MLDYQTIYKSAVALSLEDRLRLLDELWATIPDEAMPNLSPEWLEEIERRNAEIDAGTAELIPAEEVFSRVFGKLKHADPG